jgi:hypothetical protein
MAPPLIGIRSEMRVSEVFAMGGGGGRGGGYDHYDVYYPDYGRWTYHYYESYGYYYGGYGYGYSRSHGLGRVLG